MLGFDYIVFRGPEERAATWSEVSSGESWLDELVKVGRADYRDGNGFPNVYKLTAAELLPHLSRLGKHVIYFGYGVEMCADDEVLTVEEGDAG